MNSTTETYNTTSTPYNPNSNYLKKSKDRSKSKPYRNRPSKRQALLELLSFLILVAAAPAFLGGVFSIFICIAAIALAIIGLFAWTRRHVALFSLLAIIIIAACVVNIILRSLFVAQCLPYFYTAGPHRFGTGAVAVPIIPPTNNGTNNNGTVTGNDNSTLPTNSTLPGSPNVDTIRRIRSNDFALNKTSDDDDYNGKHFSNSIWCGNRVVVYVTHSILILLTGLALLVALSLLAKRKATPLPVTSTTTTQTHYRNVVQQ